VRIDGADQSVQGGNFMWLKKANAGCTLWLSSVQDDRFEGWHDGYTRLPDPVRHRRAIRLDKAARRILIEDSLDMAEDHAVELFFHCHEHAVVERAEQGYVVRHGDVRVGLTLPVADGARIELYRGSLAPMLGWVSRSFDSRAPAPTIAWRARLSGRAVLRTEIAVHCGEDAADAMRARACSSCVPLPSD